LGGALALPGANINEFWEAMIQAEGYNLNWEAKPPQDPPNFAYGRVQH